LIQPVGRADVLERARSRLLEGSSVLLHGPAGIGKSTVLAAMAGELPGARVLRAAAAEVESGLPYLTLVDLFDGVSAEEIAALPRHLRAALEAALLRGTAPVAAQDQLAVRLAVLELLRSLAAQRPILMVIDDLQWVDEPSAGVLSFVARRLGGARVQMLGAERCDGDPGHRDLCPSPCEEILLPPLTEYDTADLLRAQFGPVLSLTTIARVHQAGGGNPLFAVELGRALVNRGGSAGLGEPLPVPDRLRPLLAERLARLPAHANPVLLLIAASARPSQSLLDRDPRTLDGLREATGAGLVTVEPDGALRFSHPLLRELVYAEAGPAERAAAHELLAERVDDPVEQARHLALARPYADADLAGRLAHAAEVARLRGAPAVAADLAERAADREPDPARAPRRRLEAAQLAYAAGLTADAQRLAERTLAAGDDAEPAVRVGARLLLTDVAGQDLSAIGPVLDAAFADADHDPGLLAQVRMYRAGKAFYDGDAEGAVTELKRAEEAAEQADDTDRRIEVLTLRASYEGALATPHSDALLDKARRLAVGRPLSGPVISARLLYATSCMFHGKMDPAVEQIEGLREDVERDGTVRDLTAILPTVVVIYMRSGRCAEAVVAARDCVRLMLDMEATPGPGLVAAASAEVAGGTLERAVAVAEQAIAACRAAGDGDWLRGALAARGQGHLLEGDPAAAATAMREAFALSQRLSRFDPGVLWHADFIEALAASGARAEATEVLEEVRQQARSLGREVVYLGLARAQALIRAAGGEARAAADELATVLAEQVGHPYPLEVARAYHALGGLERRAHRRGAARAALAEAVRRYAAAQAAPWHAVAESELHRLDGGRGMGLSDTERRIVELVRAGATNREIARATFLSVKAVEANLTRLYRRLGVRNRAQLSRALDQTTG
jgi:DNA-binding CsgD family transcriptional regulator